MYKEIREIKLVHGILTHTHWIQIRRDNLTRLKFNKKNFGELSFPGEKKKII